MFLEEKYNESNIPIPKRFCGCRAKKHQDYQPAKLDDLGISNPEVSTHRSFDNFEIPDNLLLEIKTSSKKIENFLESLYPNPYKLENLNEFKNSQNCSKILDVVASKTNDTTGIQTNKNVFQESGTESITLNQREMSSKTKNRANLLDFPDFYVKHNLPKPKNRGERKTKNQQDDYDIGKLKLLTTEDNPSKLSTKKLPKTFKSKTLEECKKANEANFSKIYDTVDKTENFMMVPSKLKPQTNRSKKSTSRETSICSLKSEEGSAISTIIHEDIDQITLEEFEIRERRFQGDLSETSQRIEEVLEFMDNCLMKYYKSDEGFENHRKEKRQKKPKITGASTSSWPKATGEKKLLSTNEMSKRLIRKPRSRRRGYLDFSSSYPSVEKEINTTRTDVNNNASTTTSTRESEVIAEPDSLVVESQNELGGYIETVVVNDLRQSKALLPLSVKVRKNNSNACQVIKTALETEEMLLASSSKQQVPNFVLRIPSKVMSSLQRSFRPDQKLIIGFDSLPRILKLHHPDLSMIEFLPSPTQSLSLNSCALPLASIKREPVQLNRPQRIIRYGITIEEERLWIGSQLEVIHLASTIFIPETVRTSKSKEVITSVGFQQTPLKASSVRILLPNISYIFLEVVQSQSNEKPVFTLEKAVEEAEENADLLEKSQPNSKNEEVSNDYKSENEKQKVQDLLRRTYKIQNKLHRYLHNMTCVQSMSCPMIYKETHLGVGLLQKGPDHNLEDSMLFWCHQSQKSEISKVDNQTSYHAPEPRPVNDEEPLEDDKSSNYSFKSSKDISVDDKEENQKLLKKVLSEIDYFKKKFEKEPPEPSIEDKVVEYDREKENSKFLKTIFRGKKSTTELSLGLKDISITDIKNISVEKTKMSENHTKISISIAQEQDQKYRVSDMSKKLYCNRPSISSEFSKPDEVESYRSDSDDDYKSVMSTLSNSDPEDKDLKAFKPPGKRPRPFVKHRFDFYRKMDLDMNFNNKKSITSSTYKLKELEPIQQSLTDMQMRMRSLRKNSLNSSEYYRRALKLAKMSAGFCQSCGTRAVIPDDTFGYYKNLLPRKSNPSKTCYINSTTTPHSSYYSFRTSSAELGDINLYNTQKRVIRSSLKDFPGFWEKT